MFFYELCVLLYGTGDEEGSSKHIMFIGHKFSLIFLDCHISVSRKKQREMLSKKILMVHIIPMMETLMGIVKW